MSTVPIDPWSAGFMALGSLANSPAAAPGHATQGVGPYSSTFDTSGWSINFGSGTSAATASTTTGTPAVLANGLLKNPMVLLALVAVAVLYLNK